MMKRIYEWITKANQVLLFFAILGGIALVAFLVYEEVSRHYEPPHVAVAQTAEEAKESVVRDVNYLGHPSGIYVLGLNKRMVKPAKEPWRTAYLGSEEFSSGQIVNVIFSNGEKRLRTLLPTDGLVLTNELPDEKNPNRMKALLFSCVTEDTDGNHRLDENDRMDLYIVAEGLERPDIVVKGARGHREVTPTHLVVKTGEGNGVQFWDVDIETQAQQEIIWK